jgi:hypothetical protein
MSNPTKQTSRKVILCYRQSVHKARPFTGAITFEAVKPQMDTDERRWGKVARLGLRREAQRHAAFASA